MKYTRNNKRRKMKKSKLKKSKRKTRKNKKGGQYIVREDTDPPAYKESYDELINK